MDKSLPSRVLDGFLGNLMYAALVAAIGAIAVVLSSVFPSLSWTMRVVLGVVVFFIVFLLLVVLFNQVAVFRRRVRSQREAQEMEHEAQVARTPEAIDAKLREWLNANRFPAANWPDQNAFYSLRVTDPDDDDREYIIRQPRDAPGFVEIRTTMLVVGANQVLVDPVTARPFSPLIADLRLELARLGFENTGVGHPLRSIMIRKKIPYELLSMYTLMETFLAIRQGTAVVHEVIAKGVWLYGGQAHPA